jgi:hypothetical protein
MLDLWFVSLLDFLVRKKRESAGHPVATEPASVVVTEPAGEKGAGEGAGETRAGSAKGEGDAAP